MTKQHNSFFTNDHLDAITRWALSTGADMLPLDLTTQYGAAIDDGEVTTRGDEPNTTGRFTLRVLSVEPPELLVKHSKFTDFTPGARTVEITATTLTPGPDYYVRGEEREYTTVEGVEQGPPPVAKSVDVHQLGVNIMEAFSHFGYLPPR